MYKQPSNSTMSSSANRTTKMSKKKRAGEKPSDHDDDEKQSTTSRRPRKKRRLVARSKTQEAAAASVVVVPSTIRDKKTAAASAKKEDQSSHRSAANTDLPAAANADSKKRAPSAARPTQFTVNKSIQQTSSVVFEKNLTARDLIPVINHDVIVVTDKKSPSSTKEGVNSSSMLVPTDEKKVAESGATQQVVRLVRENVAKLSLPSSMMTSRIVPTPLGLAVILVPNTNKVAATSDYAASTSSAALTAVDTKSKHWSRAEDDLLKYAVSQAAGPPYNWTKMAQDYFQLTRNHKQCQSRWKNIDPAKKHGPFTAEEDTTILELHRQGLTFHQIAVQLPGRVFQQVRNRFNDTLDPSLKKKAPWTAEEDNILFLSQRELGNKWTEIAQHRLPGRSVQDVKNRWYNLQEKLTRRVKQNAAEQQRRVALARLRDEDDVKEDDSTDSSNSSSHDDTSSSILQASI